MSPFVATLVLLLATGVLGGPNDTKEQLTAGYTNVPLDKAYHQANVTIEHGSVPEWLSGSFIRHGCGVYGQTGQPPSDMLDRVGHVFDCIEMGVTYTFHKGHIMYTSRFYDTNTVDIYKDKYKESMELSSVFYPTILSEFNRTAFEENLPDLFNQNKSRNVAHVSWWPIGDKVAGQTEYPQGQLVDVHNVAVAGDFPFDNELLPSDTSHYGGLNIEYGMNPAHQQYTMTGELLSTTGYHYYNESAKRLFTGRLLYKVDPKTFHRTVLTEIEHKPADLNRCKAPSNGARRNEPYPDHLARLRYMHAFHVTEHYIILPETSYLKDPCSRVYGDNQLPAFIRDVTYEPSVAGQFRVIQKSDHRLVATVKAASHFFVTHMFGAYEEGDLIHLDMLKYNDTGAYTKWTYVEEAINGTELPTNYVYRYTLNTSNWQQLAQERTLVEQPADSYLEFANINRAYMGRKYRWGYAGQNLFKAHTSIVKLDMDQGTMAKHVMPDGHFATEPIFIAHPDADNSKPDDEDYGFILMSGVDGAKERSFMLILDAKNMTEVLRAYAPGKALFGLHSDFFHFNVGCQIDDCTPDVGDDDNGNGADGITLHAYLAFTALLTYIMNR